MAVVLKANVNLAGNWRMMVLGDCKRAISLEEVGEAVNEVKSGKAPGMDRFLVECLNKGGMAVLEWLVILLNSSFDIGVVQSRGMGVREVLREET